MSSVVDRDMKRANRGGLGTGNMTGTVHQLKHSCALTSVAGRRNDGRLDGLNESSLVATVQLVALLCKTKWAAG